MGRKSANLSFDFGTKSAYSLIILLVFAFVLAGVFAYGTQNPQIFGHSAKELDFSSGVNGNAVFLGSVDVRGDAKIGSSGASCNSVKQGAIRFNPTDKVFELCDGINWEILKKIPLDTYYPPDTGASIVSGEYYVSDNPGCGPPHICGDRTYSTNTFFHTGNENTKMFIYEGSVADWAAWTDTGNGNNANSKITLEVFRDDTLYYSEVVCPNTGSRSCRWDINNSAGYEVPISTGNATGEHSWRVGIIAHTASGGGINIYIKMVS